MNNQNSSFSDPYVKRFKEGRFESLMRWEQLEKFWETLRPQIDDSWYIYAVGETAPAMPSSKESVLSFITEIDQLLQKEHEERYCGIVYADNHQCPDFIKIFDPNNLGVSCGFSENPPLPGWVMSKMKPVNLQDALQPANNRRRWWQKIFA
ncbi:MAG: hypothetical protein DIZ80_15700 [endosymbiont of Galathealinum brachiosum]|uniref:Uncharacterized protein n=1 Tax=endosymbiont of Galathealinum brachiosum TaxID=2200906 RepID=A0A370D9F6_9GAMM|nr:MAG: hypothetical protein DIZ80_15700 [endosymbiont of Galathealinum brachiosum]